MNTGWLRCDGVLNDDGSWSCLCREVVERRLYTVTGEHASEEKINEIINSGHAENIFQEALMAQGRGKVILSSHSRGKGHCVRRLM